LFASVGLAVFCAPQHNNAGEQVDFWQVLPVAVALVFIIEGVLPFISPHRWRNMLAMADQMNDRVIRNIGLGSMLVGLLLLYLVH
jgi:uncharacterized protein YjeT (DUF2065 family)